MRYSKEEVMQYIEEEDVKFIRLAFCDVLGKLKNISVMPQELESAFEKGVVIDSSSVTGFDYGYKSELVIHPDPATLSLLPWRPEHGRVVRMLCSVTYPSGELFEADCRELLKKSIDKASAEGYKFQFGSGFKFYLFKTDDNGNPTNEPYDYAGYMDVAPEDKGENIRREVCLMLEQMGVLSTGSYHEAGPGQNEIDYRMATPLLAADQAVLFKSAVRTIANRNGLFADLSPKPLAGAPGNDYHILMHIESSTGKNVQEQAIAGILAHAAEMTVFMNPVPDSYSRLGTSKAPGYVTWSQENRTQMVRVPSTGGIEIRSADPEANPYLALLLLIEAAMDGINNHMDLMEPADFDAYVATVDELNKYKALPGSLQIAQNAATNSAFVKKCLPAQIISAYCD